MVCARAREFERAFRMLALCRADGFDLEPVRDPRHRRPRSYSRRCCRCRAQMMYNTIIHNMFRAGLYHRARDVYEEMKRVGVQPTLHTYATLIRIAAQASARLAGSTNTRLAMSATVEWLAGRACGSGKWRAVHDEIDASLYGRINQSIEQCINALCVWIDE